MPVLVRNVWRIIQRRGIRARFGRTPFATGITSQDEVQYKMHETLPDPPPISYSG